MVQSSRVQGDTCAPCMYRALPPFARSHKARSRRRTSWKESRQSLLLPTYHLQRRHPSVLSPRPRQVYYYQRLISAHECSLMLGQVTLGILEQAKLLSIPALWLQPGAEDDAVVEYIKEQGLSDRTIYGGPCILVEGDGVKKSLL